MERTQATQDPEEQEAPRSKVIFIKVPQCSTDTFGPAEIGNFKKKC